jgi:hypothetical protein
MNSEANQKLEIAGQGRVMWTFAREAAPGNVTADRLPS